MPSGMVNGAGLRGWRTRFAVDAPSAWLAPAAQDCMWAPTARGLRSQGSLLVASGKLKIRNSYLIIHHYIRANASRRVGNTASVEFNVNYSMRDGKI